jgi:hypothetical protein
MSKVTKVKEKNKDFKGGDIVIYNGVYAVIVDCFGSQVFEIVTLHNGVYIVNVSPNSIEKSKAPVTITND